jgi:hypothetical protein
MTDLMYTIGAKFDGADEVNKSLQNIDRSADSTVKAIKRFDQEMKRAEAAQKKGTLTAQGYTKAKEEAVQRLMSYGVASDRATQSVERNTAAMQRGQRVTLQTGSAQQALRQRFLETANSIAVLDGPLGGVASRFSSFGVLVGRTGIALAAAGVAFTSFTVLANRAIREFAEFEVQLATIENRLNSTSTQVSLTSREIVKMADSIAMSTLASEKAILSAAAQVLTFGNITTETFEGVLRSATDLAASGFGTVESSAMMLSKALEDPRQSLTSLSRSGVTFTRQQRAMIISMVEAGRQAEAMALILAQVNRQVGGAAEAQARDTLAGQFDTIGQAVRMLTRDFGELLAEDLGLRAFVTAIAEIAAELNKLDRLTAEEKLKALNDAGKDSVVVFGDFRTVLRSVFSGLGIGIPSSPFEVITREALEAQVVLDNTERSAKNLRDALNAIGRRDTAIDAIKGEIEVRQQNLFLTEDQIRVNRELAAQGFGVGGLDGMASEMQRVVEAMTAAGRPAHEIMRTVDEMVASFNEAAGLSEQLTENLSDTRISSTLTSNLQTLQQQNETQRLINEAMLGGADAAEARRVAEDAMLDTLLASARAVAERTGASLESVEALERELDASRRLRDQHEAITTSRQLSASITEIRDNLEAELDALIMQRDMIEAGKTAREISAAIARQSIEIELQKQEALVTQKFLLGEINREEALRLALIIAQARVAADALADINVNVNAPSSGGGGGTDQSERERERLEKEIQAMRLRFEIMQGFMSEEIQVQLIHFQEQDRLLDEALQMGILKHEEHYRLQELLRREHEQTMAQITLMARNQQLNDFGSFMGAMAGVAQAGGQRMTRVVAAFSGIQATINAWTAYTEVLKDPSFIGRPWARFAAAAGVLSAGLGAVANIRRAGGGGGGGGVSSVRSAAEVAVPSGQTQAAPQRVLIQGLDPNALFTGEQIQNLFESLYNENENRGRVFVVQT